MKTLLISLMGIVISTSVLAQEKLYYWSDKRKIEMTFDHSSYIIHTKGGPKDKALQRFRSPSGTDNIKSFPHKDFAIVSADAKGVPVKEMSRSMREVQSDMEISPALRLNDGYTMYLTRRLVFKPKGQGSLRAIEKIIAQYPTEQVTEKWGTYRVDLKHVKDVLVLSNSIQESGLTEFAHPDFYAPTIRNSDPFYPEQFQLNNTGQTVDGIAGVSDIDCNAPEAWAITKGSSSIRVAILDDGFEDHEDLRDASGASRLIKGFTPVNGGDGTPMGSAFHGMACTGVIAASHNDIGIRGVAPQVELLGVNMLSGGETVQDIADGFFWARDNGADVISCAWSFRSCDADFPDLTASIKEVAKTGRNGKGCVVVFASGNNASMSNCVAVPGNIEEVVAVGAVTNKGVRASYSQFGPKLNLVAPSSSRVGIIPMPGVRTIDRMGQLGFTSSNYNDVFGGTSAAGPLVAGVAALVLSVNPNLTADKVREILYTTATDMGSPGRDDMYGAGRVNAYAAVKKAMNSAPPTTGGECVDIDINRQGLVSYAGNQDQGGFRIKDRRKTIIVFKNAWKAIPIEYDVTASTRLQFDFRSTREGEEHSIGLDNDLFITSGNRFKLFGVQNTGGAIRDFDNYDGSKDFKSYSIPVGRYYTGAMKYLFFVADNDARPDRGNSFFSNIVIFDDTNNNGINDECGTTLRLNAGDDDDTFAESTGGLSSPESISEELILYPNPAKDQLNIDLKSYMDSDVQYSITTMTGKTIKEGYFDNHHDRLETLDLKGWLNGMYLISIQVEGKKPLMKKIIIQ